MLTPRQAELLRYLSACQDAGDGVSPSYRQMANALGAKSPSGMFRLLAALEERGFIRRKPGAIRAITVIRRPSDPAPKQPEVSLDDLRYMVGLVCQQEGFSVTCAALISMAQEIVPTPEAR